MRTRTPAKLLVPETLIWVVGNSSTHLGCPNCCHKGQNLAYSAEELGQQPLLPGALHISISVGRAEFYSLFLHNLLFPSLEVHQCFINHSSVTKVILTASFTKHFQKLSSLYSVTHGAWQMRGLFLQRQRKVNKKNKLLFSRFKLATYASSRQWVAADKKSEYVHLKYRKLPGDRSRKSFPH